MKAPDRTAAARQLGITLADDQWNALERYVELLRRWNVRFNLVSRRDVDRVWNRHVLDSLSILPLLATVIGQARWCRALDVGTGAGFPGLPLAVADPTVEWQLIDRNARKVRFLELVIHELELENATARALDLRGAPPDDLLGWANVIVSRAMEAPAALVERSGSMLTPDGAFLLMTGAAGGRPSTTGTMCRGYRVVAVHELRIPGLDQVHEVTIIRKDTGAQVE